MTKRHDLISALALAGVIAAIACMILVGAAMMPLLAITSASAP